MTSTTSSQPMLNHHHHHQQLGLFEDQMCAQMGFYSFPPNNNNLGLPPLTSSSSPSSSSCHQSLKNFTILPSTTNNSLHETLLISSSASPKLVSSHDHLQRSSANLWTWEGHVNHEGNNIIKRGGGDHNNQYVDDHSKIHNKIGVSAMNMKMKKMKATRRKVREPRFSFKTMSDVDVLDDGYKWRKYGQKVVKNTRHPRSYYRCTKDSCRVKKRVERLAEDPRMVITTYEGRHAHSPSHDLEPEQSPSHLNNFFC